MRNILKLFAPVLAVAATLALLALGALFSPLVFAQPGQPAGQSQALITVATAGTPVQISTSHIVVASLMIQPVVGSTVGLVYVCTGIRTGTTPASYCAATANGSYELGAELAAATATIPGPVYGFYVPAPGVDLSTYWLDAAVSGTVALVSWFAHQ